MNGYIPDSGLWTAEERKAYEFELTPPEAVSHDGSDNFDVTPVQMRRHLATVAALIRALEDATDALFDALKRAGDCTDEEMSIVDGSRALLAALKGEK